MIDVLGSIANTIVGNKNAGLFLRRFRSEYGTRKLLAFLKRAVVENMLIGRHLRWKAERNYGFSPGLQITFTPLSKCNLTCAGCYAETYFNDEQLDPSVVSRVIDEGKRMGIRSFAILGGEPFLWNGLFEVLTSNPDVLITIVTNGTLIDDEVAQQLAEAENAFPFLSIDGFKDRNDAWRGEGVYDRVVSAMASLKRHRVLFGFSVTVTTDNFDEVSSAAFVDFLIEKGAYYGAYSPWGPAGRNPGFKYLLTDRQVEDLFERLGLLEKIRPIFFHKEGHYDGTSLNRGCGAGRVVNIMPDGSIAPCNAIHFSTGDVRVQSLADILNHPFLKAIRTHADSDPHHRCVGLFHAQETLDIARGSDAKPTNPQVPCRMQDVANYLKTRKNADKETA
ncbi:MAG: radical SAM protein [Nitrospirota bacterium]